MTRDERSLVFVAAMLGMPLVAWLSVAAWRYGLERPVARGLLKVAKLTPHDDFLIGALVIGALAGFVLADWIIRRYDTQFGGASSSGSCEARA